MGTTKFYKIVIILLILLNIGTLTFLWLNKPKPFEQPYPHVADREIKESPQQEKSAEVIQNNKTNEPDNPEAARNERPKIREKERDERPSQDRPPEETPHNDPNEFIKQELNFNKEQEIKFNILSNKHFNREKQINDSLRIEKKNFFDLLSSANDSKKEEYLYAIGNLEKGRLLNNYDFFREIKKICTEEQQEKLDGILRDVLRMLAGPPRK